MQPNNAVAQIDRYFASAAEQDEAASLEQRLRAAYASRNYWRATAALAFGLGAVLGAIARGWM